MHSCHFEERSDEESVTTKLLILLYLYGKRFTLRALRFTPPSKADFQLRFVQNDDLINLMALSIIYNTTWSDLIKTSPLAHSRQVIFVTP